MGKGWGHRKGRKVRSYAATIAEVDPIKKARSQWSPSAAQAADRRTDAPQPVPFSQFEEANPILKGGTPSKTSPVSAKWFSGGGGGGKSGGARYIVQPYRGSSGKEDTFGDTAAAMVEGPVAGMKAFAGGLSGGPSPSRDYLANDPLTKSLPGPVLTGLGAVGDLGVRVCRCSARASLARLALALRTHVPGQGAMNRRKFAEDPDRDGMFAVPELAGGSSIPPEWPPRPPRPPIVARPPRLPDDVAAADRLGIPVMLGDVKPHQQPAGKVAQHVGENIPVAGQQGMRAEQFTRRRGGC